MTTILGSNINTIRPRNIAPFGLRNADRPKARYDKAYQSKTIKEHSGKVIAVCVKLVSGGVRAIAKGTHIQVIEMFDIDPENIVATGWQLDNGNFIWR